MNLHKTLGAKCNGHILRKKHDEQKVSTIFVGYVILILYLCSVLPESVTYLLTLEL